MSETVLFKSEDHDHDHCVADALAAAARICEERGERLTPLRRQVLELVWASHRPARAYDLLDRLQEHRSSAAPPTVYRVLDFLLEQGLVHRIESLNAFVGCGTPGDHHGGQFLICRSCEKIAELDAGSITDAVEQVAAENGFQVERQTVEAFGLCPDCAGDL